MVSLFFLLWRLGVPRPCRTSLLSPKIINVSPGEELVSSGEQSTAEEVDSVPLKKQAATAEGFPHGAPESLPAGGAGAQPHLLV